MAHARLSPCQNTRVLYKYATLFPSISSQSQLCQRKVLFFLIYFFQCNPHTHTMEVTVIFSSNHRAVSDGTCVLNKTGRRTDVMLSGLCFSFFFSFSFHIAPPLSLLPICWLLYGLFLFCLRFIFFLAANHSEGTVEEDSCDTLSSSMDGFL